jgi:proline dehydrogenase
MATRDGFARRFIAGETIEEAIEVARALQARGMLLTLDYLGESVSTTEAASSAAREYVRSSTPSSRPASSGTSRSSSRSSA